MSDLQLVISDRIATITLQRQPVNALSSAMYRALQSALDEVGTSTDISVLVLTSASSRAFCAGADITELGQLVGDAARTADADRQVLARSVFDRLLDLPWPTIAVLDGPAIGAGAVLASCCDIRIASARASFQLPEIDVGRCGGGRHLMRHLPQNLVRAMYFTGRPISAQTAAGYGMVDLVDDGADPIHRARELAATLAAKSPIALRLGKQALNRSESLDVRNGYELEQEYTLLLAATDDAREALLARREKRAPRFVGH
jgi:enoyl-CoA hydratase